MTGEDEITLHRPLPVAVGDRVEKVAGYKWPGIVVAVFDTLGGEKRYVVECTALEVAGALHIYNGSQLRKVTGVDRPARRACRDCSETMEGDGHTVVYHCPSVDVINSGIEPDANPVYCGGSN